MNPVEESVISHSLNLSGILENQQKSKHLPSDFAYLNILVIINKI